MGLDFGKPEAMTGDVVVPEKNEIEEVKQYDIVADRQQLNTTLTNSKEVDDIVSTIEVYNLDTIVSFGSEVAEEISRASDVVLNNTNMSQLDDSSELLNTLTKIMNQFDIDELKENPGLFGKLFGNLRKQLDKIIDKYHARSCVGYFSSCGFNYLEAYAITFPCCIKTHPNPLYDASL